ncbi:MAG: tRNA lysidine(34) synthetase TilS [Sphingomonadaceae bacterium]
MPEKLLLTELDPEAVVARVLRFAVARELFLPGTVVVAVSGGQDSLCMLDVLRRLRGELRIDLHVAHLNHMFRGAQSEAEAEYVRDLSREWSLPVTVGAIDVPAYRSRNRLAKQVAARYARYQFLAAVARQVGAGQVSVGHTADDAVETLLMNLLRGAGLAGLRGILPRRDMDPGQLGPDLEPGEWKTGPLPSPEGPLATVVRPILELFRVETEGYCRARGIAFRRDPSNLDLAYRRNWIRAELLPVLEQHVPRARDRLRNAADLLSDEYSVVAGVVDRCWSDLAKVEPGRVVFDLGEWDRLDAALRRHLLRKAMATLAGSLEEFSRLHVDAAEAVIRRGAVGARVDLPRGVCLQKGYNSFWLVGPSAPPPLESAAPEAPVRLPVPGSVALSGAVLEAELLERGGEGIRNESCSRSGRWEVCLDAATTGSELWVRRRRRGDRFVPLGMTQPKKLQDFMVDEKIPREERDRIPVVTASDQIVWVVGYRIDERFKVTADTRRVLRLRFRRTEEE